MSQIHYLIACIFGFVEAHPIVSRSNPEIFNDVLGLNSFYITILVVLVLSGTFLAGCLCCKRKKGFQEFSPRAGDNAGGNIEFSNPLSTVNTQSEITLFPPSGSTPITFDPLPPLTPKHQQVPALNPRPAAFTDALTKGISVQTWFQEPQDNFPRQHLHYLRECGRGWFGRVVEGEARGILPNGRTSRVIVRILREGATESEQKFFLHEAKPYVELSHPNILRLFGRCLENDPFLLLFEACNGGDLKSWLTQNVTSRETLMQQGITMRMAVDIASGLAHMNHHGFVHTDLAARNVLVTSDLRIKVGDYGTSIETFKDDYYCFGEVALPIRWCAPETLLCTETTIETKEVTAPANVWSFGIVLWEICEFGKLPYTDLSDDQVIVFVLGSDKVRLPEPSFPSPFKNHLYYLMQLCWRSHKERPSISHILSMLNHLLTSKIKTQNDMDDFERRWENMKPNTVPKTDNHTPTMSEERVKSDNDSGVVLDNKNVAFSGSEMDLSSKKLLAESSSSMTISPQLSVTSSSGGEFFSQTSSPVKLKSPSLQNLQGSLDDINEAVSCEQGAGLDLWLQNIEIKNEKDAKLVSGVYKAINDLDNALSLEKTSSSNDSSCYDSPSSNRKPSVNLVPDFKLGPFVNNNFRMDQRFKFQPDSFQDDSFIMKRTGDSSGTDTEDEMWRRRIERGEFSEKVKEKSKSIANLMVLTHIDNSDGSESDSLPSFSFNKMVRQNTKLNALGNSIGFGSDTCIYSSLTAEQSDRDLKKFQNALKKKDMDDPSLNFLRRDSLSYFINNPNFKFSDSSSNSSSNFHQTDHFLEIRASEKISNAPKTTLEHNDKSLTTLPKSVPKIQVSSCISDVESVPDEPSVLLNFEPKKFKFVFKDIKIEEKTETQSPATVTSATDNSYENLMPKVEEKFDSTVSYDSIQRSGNYNTVSVSENSNEIGKESTSDLNLTEKFDSTGVDVSVESGTIAKCESSTKNYDFDPTLSCSQTNAPVDGESGDTGNNLTTQWSLAETKDDEQKIFSFELGDSGIIIDEPSENSKFILPISCESNLESSVILGSCEDFTLDLYKGLKTSSGTEVNLTHENEDEIENETVLEWNRKNKLNEKQLQENGRSIKSENLDENCDRIFIETVENSDSFIPDNNKGVYTYDHFYEEQSDDTYIDSGKSSDVLEDENYELKPYSSYNNLADPSLASQDSKDCSNQPEFYFGTDHTKYSHTSSEDLDALKLLTPDDEKSSDTGFRDKSSPSESCDDMWNDKYNLEDIENELENIQPPLCIECPEFFQKASNEVTDKKITGNVVLEFEKNGLVKDRNSNYKEENFKLRRDRQPTNSVDDFESNSLFYGNETLSDQITSDRRYRRDEEELPPPSYEEYERLHGVYQGTFGVKQDQPESPRLSFPTRLSRERCNSNSSADSDGEAYGETISEGGTEGWYLHSRSPDHEAVHSNWLPESISDDDNRNEPVNEELFKAIRMELNEKLLKMHLPGLDTEKEEETDDDLIICEDSDPKKRSRKGQDIFIQYNSFPEYLSPIAEEDETECSSVSSLCSEDSDSSKTLSLNDTEKEVIATKSDVEDQESENENDDIIEVNMETNEVRLVESPLSMPQQSFSQSEPTTEQLESIDQCSEYSVDSISPETGSPSATNPNALSFSSINENLSEVFQSPNSDVSDLTFPDDKTIRSESTEECETDVEGDDCLTSPQKEPELTVSFSETPVNQPTETMKNIMNLLLNPTDLKSNLAEVKEPPKLELPKSDEWLKSILLPSDENSLLKSDVDSFDASNWPKTHSLTPVVTAESETNVTLDELNDKVSGSVDGALKPDARSTHTESNTSPFSTSHVINNQVDLSSTIAFETPEPEMEKSSSNGISNSVGLETSSDSLENYKNYCRKKFKITKVDENIKPIFCEKSTEKSRSNEELNRRLNEINKEARDRLEINVQMSEASVPMPSPSEQTGISIPTSWPVFDAKNSEIDTNDDQMMSTSFIDSETEENVSEGNWNDGDFKSKATFDDGDFWCGSSEFSVPLNRIVEESDNDKNDDDFDDEDDEDTADFVPSSWNSQATPNKSVLKSPEPRNEPKKTVSFKRQRYHCVYEYPREEHSDTEDEANRSRFSPLINFDFSEYTDWEMGLTDDIAFETQQDSETESAKPDEKHDVYTLTPVDKDFSFNSELETDEFFISSSTRPFKNDQGSLNCQFFPGKSYIEENFKPLAADIGEESKSEKT